MSVSRFVLICHDQCVRLGNSSVPLTTFGGSLEDFVAADIAAAGGCPQQQEMEPPQAARIQNSHQDSNCPCKMEKRMPRIYRFLFVVRRYSRVYLLIVSLADSSQEMLKKE